MAIRYLKILLILSVALMCLLYAVQNVVNLDAAYSFVSTVLSMDGHAAYPDSLGPAITSPALVWAALFIIILLEVAAGLLAGKGAWDMWDARNGSATVFNSAKTIAVLGCGVGLLVWFGLFSTIGGAYFQMWQTELGGASLHDSLRFTTCIGVIMLFVNMPDT
jgi:predicted small integral membrane protein